MRLAADAEDVGGLFRREPDELPVATPQVALVVQEVVDLVALREAGAE